MVWDGTCVVSHISYFPWALGNAWEMSALLTGYIAVPLRRLVCVMSMELESVLQRNCSSLKKGLEASLIRST
jgi:hypothetical protein